MKKFLSILLVSMVATTAFAGVGTKVLDDNTGYDRFYSGPWTNNWGSWRDDIPANGDVWIATNMGHFATTTGDGAWAGLYRGATGDTAELYYPVTFDATDVANFEPENPWYLTYDAKCTVSRINNRSMRVQVSLRDGGANVDGSVSYSPYFVSADDANPLTVEDNAIYMGLGTESGLVYNGPVAADLGAVGWTMDSLVEGNMTIRVRLPQNDGLVADGNPEIGAKNIGVAVSNLKFGQALDGDANIDQVIDNIDIGAVFGNYGVGTAWADGDFNGDALVDNIDIGSVFGNYGTSYEADPGKADLVYDPATGNVTLDGAEAAGGVIANFVITDDEGGLVGAAAQTNPFLGAFFTNTEFQLSGSDPLTTGLATIEFAGLLPAGLTLAEVQDMLDSATYVGALGSGVQDFDIVPEPATMSLLGFGALALIRRKK